jgi:hypothetical protein
MFANSPRISSNFSYIIVLFSVTLTARPDNHSNDIDDLRQSFINFNFEKHVSPDPAAIGNVKRIHIASMIFGVKSYL